MIQLEGELNFRPHLLARTAWDAEETLVVQSRTAFPPAALPGVWLGLERLGGALVASYSRDAVTWREVARVELEPSWRESLLVGLAATMTCDAGPACTTPLGVTFCDVTLEGEVAGDGPRFRRGDVDGRGRVNLTDAVTLATHLFRGGNAPSCADAADTDDDGKLDLTDVVGLVRYLFRGEAAPVRPGPIECGEDADETDGLRECEGGCS